MSMSVRIKRRLRWQNVGDDFRQVEHVVTHYGDGTGNPRLAVECDVIHPPSMAAEGRKAFLFLDDADVTALILVLRNAAVEARR